MTPQESVLAITAVFVAICALIFIFAIGIRGDIADEAASARIKHGWELLRVGAFSFMVISLIFVSFFSLVRFPIPVQAHSLDADKVIDAVGRQWSWQLSDDTVRVGERVQFNVTSDDINHGFAIYNEAGRLLTQVQAMPTVTNKLLYEFDEPGTYHVLCLEYCGIGHANMRTEIHVVATDAAESSK